MAVSYVSQTITAVGYHTSLTVPYPDNVGPPFPPQSGETMWLALCYRATDPGCLEPTVSGWSVARAPGNGNGFRLGVYYKQGDGGAGSAIASWNVQVLSTGIIYLLDGTHTVSPLDDLSFAVVLGNALGLYTGASVTTSVQNCGLFGIWAGASPGYYENHSIVPPGPEGQGLADLTYYFVPGMDTTAIGGSEGWYQSGFHSPIGATISGGFNLAEGPGLAPARTAQGYVESIGTIETEASANVVLISIKPFSGPSRPIITAPVDAETITIGRTYPITWTASTDPNIAQSALTYSLDYSLNDGLSWTPLNVPYSDAVIADGPLLYWRFGESSGATAADSSGNGRHGTINGTMGYGLPSLLSGDPNNTDFTFSGATFLTIADAAWMDVTNLSIEAWIKTTATGSTRNIASRDDTTTDHMWQLRITSTGLLEIVLWFGGSTGIFTSAVNVADGSPHHVVATYNGSHAALYVDSIQVLQTAETRTLNTGTQQIEVGSVADGGGQFFSGGMGEFALYNRALSGTEILQHYISGSSGAPGATTYPWNTTGLAATPQAKLRIRSFNGTEFSAYDTTGRITLATDVTPGAPINCHGEQPDGTTVTLFDRTLVLLVKGTFSDLGDVMTGYQLDWGTDGITYGAASGTVSTSVLSHSYPLATFANGLVYFRARTKDTAGNFGGYAFFQLTAATPPTTPNILSPTTGAPPDRPLPTISWTSANQIKYRITITQGGVVRYAGGFVSSSATSVTSPFPFLNDTTYVLEIDYQDASGLTSPKDSETVRVSYIGPAKPLISVS